MTGGNPLGRKRQAARLAESRRCPKCDRKSSLKTIAQHGQAVTYCRRDDCDYESVTDLTELL